MKPSSSPRSVVIWRAAAGLAWLVAIAIVTIRSGGGHRHCCAFADFRMAGLHWIQGAALYTDYRGFVYSPAVAVCFEPFACLPARLGVVIWQLLNATVFIGGLTMLIRFVYPGSFRRHAAGAALLLLPFALGNLDVGQSNPLLAGLVMAAIAAASIERWGTVAVCVTIAAALKIYPLSIGLLICVLAPRRFGWRLLAALVVTAVAPFFFQHEPYVLRQYHAWISARSIDDRLSYPLYVASLDGWFLLHWLGHLEIPHLLYKLLQAGSGGVFALLCFWGKRKGWTPDRLLNGVFCFGSVWMTLFGPATEGYTYLLLSPAIVLVFLRSFVEHHAPWLKVGFGIAFGLQLFAIARSSLNPHFSPVWALAAQPFSALLFLVTCVGWLMNDSCWPPAGREIGRLVRDLEFVDEDLTVPR